MTEPDSHVPEYTVVETEGDITVVISAPLSKPKEAAFVLEKNVFTFESPPYELKIKLPHPVHDRFSQKSYEYDTKTFKIKLKKDFESVGEDTDDDGKIVYSETRSQGGESESLGTEDGKQFYGFSNLYSRMFGKLYEEFSEVISLPNPDSTDVAERRKLREQEELEKWSDDHYLADTMETDHLDAIFSYRPPWVASPARDFTNDEREMLAEVITKSKTAVSEDSVRLSEFQLIDILFGFAYNKRTTEGENTVESGWTINKLSSTLSWFEVFEDLQSLLLSCYRRSLTFPLYRSWKLACLVHEDVVDLLRGGPRQVTQSLLEVREIFNDSDNRYILNSLYVNDLCGFAYHMTDERCSELAEALSRVEVRKHEVSSDLPLLELGAQWALEEATGRCGEAAEARLGDIVDRVAGLKLDRSGSEGEESEGTEASGEGG